MNKVTIWCWAQDDGKNLRKGDCFESALSEELKYAKKHFPDNKYFKLLFAKTEELKKICPSQDVLDTLFRENVTIDFEFAKQLKLYDIISADCFYSENATGNALIRLMNYADLKFVLYMRGWKTPNEVVLEFEVTHCDFVREVHLKFVKGEVYNW